MSKRKSPTMEVTVPIVRLSVEDLAYLKSMTLDGPRCAISNARLSKLKLLGLIKRANVGPLQTTVSAFRKKAEAFKSSLPALARNEQWDAIQREASNLEYAKRRLEPHDEDVISSSGKALLTSGTVRVTLPQGCGTRGR